MWTLGLKGLTRRVYLFCEERTHYGIIHIARRKKFKKNSTRGFRLYSDIF